MNPKFQLFLVVAIAFMVGTIVGSRVGVRQFQDQNVGQIRIIKATYGFGDRIYDVTSYIQNVVDVKGPVDIFDGARLTDVLGDPSFGTVKNLIIDYENKGERKQARFIDAVPGPRVSLG